ncbi:hypothetical protein [Nostoc sp.]|uniref:hypothetical protein n=1 Tax=Nostoc sp. TaxID=1180 RepID=UPI002FF86A64
MNFFLVNYSEVPLFASLKNWLSNFNYNNDGFIRLLGFPLHPPMPSQTRVWIGLTQRPQAAARLPQAV